jgi:hypothetical protein
MRGERPSARFPMRSSAFWAAGARHAGEPWRCRMAHSLTDDDKFHEESSGDYRFARTHVKRGNRMRSALRPSPTRRCAGCGAISRFAAFISIRTAITGWCVIPCRRSIRDEQGRPYLAVTRCRQVFDDVSRSVLGWASQAIPPRGTLYARSRTEMAGEALSRPCIGRRRVRSPCEPEPAQQQFCVINGFRGRQGPSTNHSRVRRPGRQATRLARWRRSLPRASV